MRRWSFLIVRPRLSSSNPNFSKPRSRTAYSDSWNYIKKDHCIHAWAHESGGDQLLTCLKDWNLKFLLCEYIYQKGGFWEVGVGDRQSLQESFPVCGWTIAFFWGFMTCTLWNPEVISDAMILKCRPNSTYFFFIVASTFYCIDRVHWEHVLQVLHHSHLPWYLRHIDQNFSDLAAFWTQHSWIVVPYRQMDLMLTLDFLSRTSKRTLQKKMKVVKNFRKET